MQAIPVTIKRRGEKEAGIPVRWTIQDHTNDQAQHGGVGRFA